MKIEQLIEELYSLESQKLALEKEISQRRQLIQDEMLEANTGQFKGEFGTISLTDRKTITFKKEKEEVCQYLLNKGLENFVDVIPEHLELNKDFDKAVKDEFGIKGLESFIEVKSNPTLITRFNK